MYRSSKLKYLRSILSFTFVITLVWHATPRSAPKRVRDFSVTPPPPDSTQLKYPIKDKKPYDNGKKNHPLDLSDPPGIKEKYTLDQENYRYDHSTKVGNLDYKLPASTSISEQMKADSKKNNSAYFSQRAQAQNFAKGSGILPQLNIGNKVVDKIFGNGVIDIRPRGTAEVIFSGNFNKVENPAFSLKQQKTGQFDFKQKIQLNVTGQVGDKLKVNMNYDTEATFEFENQMKLDYAGKDDDIIKKIELGNVSLPLNSSLIQGSQSLFGVKTTLQFGKLTVTAVVSQQRGKTQETELAGGTSNTPFNIQCDGYDMNRHYFLSHYFRDNYEYWLKNLPFIGSPIVITRVEVWVTNRSGSFEQSRDVVGFADLGESTHRDNKYWTVNTGVPLGNGANNLYDPTNPNTYLNGYGNPTDAAKFRASYQVENKFEEDRNTTQLKPISQYQIVNFARQLGPNEYTFNPRLGFVSLNQALNNDDVLSVAYEGTNNGVPFKVGDFSQDIPRNTANPEVLFLKMLKGPSLRPDLPIWDLMMKNVYSLGSFQIQPKDFKLSLVYADDPSGADLNYLPVKNEPLVSNTPLLNVFNLDKMNTQLEPVSDGIFDYIEGVTINSQTGRVYLPSVEPFGKFLQTKFLNDPNLANYYCFFALYDSTKFSAIQQPQYNKFFLRGSFQGASTNEISLGSSNVPRGSVKVTANGAPLTENSDYVVDYNLGRVKIVNTALLNSGASIKVSSESNNLFQIQQKSLMGARFDYKYNPNLVLGSTFMYLNERPLTPKVNIGEEPISNIVIGLDGSYTRKSMFLTKMVDKLPFLTTKEPSSFTVSGEYARLIPGVQKALGQKGTAYLDDFEGAETPFDLRMGNTWALASTPQGQPDLFPEGNLLNKLEYGFKRANLAWYTIATTFYRNDNYTPKHLRDDPSSISTHATREVLQQDVFKNKQIQQGLPTTLPTFDLSFYPNEKGPYNYTVDGLNPDGTLKSPATNWGGIMRKIDQNDFEQANIDYIEMWVMDPFADKPASVDKGYLYINLGNISEDILRDNRRAAENGLPKNNSPEQTSQADTTAWGIVPRAPVINYAFDADPDVRKNQDIGLDGLSDDAEKVVLEQTYLQKLSSKFGPTATAYTDAAADPSNDNYHYYLGTDYDNTETGLLDRYKKFNRHQGNSPTLLQSPESYPTASTNIPDNEDLNKDYTVNGVEEYFQYKIEIARDAFTIGRNYVTDTLTANAKFINGDYAPEKWYQLKIPVREFDRKVGDINDFKSIRFIRMYMRGFSEHTILRMASLQLVRADWRKYLNNLEAGGEHKPIDPTNNTQFVVSTVNIEKNGQRKPIIYTVPPGIQREIDFSSPNSIQQNEQSLSLLVCNLKDGDARAVFKNTNADLRQYGKLRMFLHAEGADLKNEELTAFFRFGTDLTNNYYEYEIPLQVTPSGASDPDVIWPTSNEMTILLEEMINTKIARTNNGVAFTAPFSRKIGNGTYTVVGMPDFSQLKIMMMGIRNPKRKPGSSSDDGLPKCAEVWFNELRMTDFNTIGGDAATGRALAKLADFGNVQLSGTYRSVGWGGIDKKMIERSMADNYIYDLQTNFELGRFFPKNFGISIPFFFSYGNTIIRPYYNPLNPDTKLQKEIDETTNPERKDQISRASDDYTARKSYNFTNVRKNRVGSKIAYPWDIENFTFTYNYNENYRRNQTIEYNILKNYKGIIGYNYNFINNPVTPLKFIKNKNLELLSDFNFNYLPASWGFRVEADRRYGEMLNRNNDSRETLLPVMYDKMFTMRRYYELRWDLTRNIKLDYNATADARIDEPAGKISDATPEKQDTIRKNFWKGGRMTKFDQTARANINIPVNKIPYMQWVSQFTYTYAVNYQWLQAPPAADSLGNTIQNSQQQAWNLNLNFVQFYNKFGAYRKIVNPKQSSPPRSNQKELTDGGEDAKKKKKAKEDNTRDKYPMYVVVPVKLLTMVKNAGGSYTTTRGTIQPGFHPKPQYFGQNFDVGAPGFDFIFGMQDPNFRYKAADNGWISKDPRVVNPYVQSYQEAISARALLEPIEDFKIDLTATKNYSKSLTAYFRYDPDSNGGMYRDFGTPVEMGSYSISYSIIRTSFSKEDGNGVTEAFKQFEDNRIVVARRLAAQKGLAIPNDSFPEGYGPYQQDVLIPSFLAAYRGVSADKIGLTPFQNFPIPNWKVTYNGLSKISLVKDFASNVSLQSSYQSTYNVAGFQTVMDTARNTTLSTDFTPTYVIRQISVSERFGPLLGIDITFLNNITTSFKYNRDRTLNLALGNRQLNEQRGSEFVIGVGYRTSKLVLPFDIGGRKRMLNNDINFRFDFSIRENLTTVRNLDRPTNEPVSGQNVVSIKPTIDYMINQKLMLRLFYDRRRTTPFTSNSFPTVITSGGFSVRYTIQ